MKYISSELKKFSSQIRFALENYKQHRINKDSLNAVLICGMGGSGIAGRIIKNYFQDKIDVPVDTISDYVLPRYAGKNTLVILCSYSGNTEETLAVYDIAKERECQVIAISTGGKLSEKASNDENILYQVEPGNQPRMALGAPLTYLFLIFFELLGVHKKPDLSKIADAMENTDDYIMHSAELAEKFKNALRHKFIVVCDPYFEGVAIRFCQQINENAKSEAFVNVLPEANHNVIESYYEKRNSNFIFLNSRLSHRTNLRFSFVKSLLKKYGTEPVEILVKDTSLSSLFDIIYQLDWLSLQVADGLDKVSNKIPNINELKEFLEKQV